MLKSLFGEGQNLTALQMSVRGIAIFFVALILIRISGRRSFGIKEPLDNIIIIVLGAVLSRAIVGASPFISVTVTCFAIVLLHRFVSWLAINNKQVCAFVQGSKIVLFQNGKFIKPNMKKGLVCEEDVLQGVRKTALTETLSDLDQIFLERTGEISVTKKKK